MSDATILNVISGNGLKMGIPIELPKERILDIRQQLQSFIRTNPPIILESHVNDHLAYDMILPDGHPEKRGWKSREEVIACAKSISRVEGVRLNFNRSHPNNNATEKHLHDDFAFAIKGSKDDLNDGKLVLTVVNIQLIRIITIL